MKEKFILWFDEVGIRDVAKVGGKNASLGEMTRELGKRGVEIPYGFIVTADAYRYFLERTRLKYFIKDTLRGLNTHNLYDLARRGKMIREAMRKEILPFDLQKEIMEAYRALEKKYGAHTDVAVRSSATAEDLPDASFAGEHDTFLGIRGAEHVVEAVRAAMASLFTDRAISYREDKGFEHFSIALSVGVQKMVRSDKGSSGVMFTLDTESGFRDIVLINATWGLGELIVQGEVTPDEYLVYKKTLRTARAPIVYKKIGMNSRKMIYAGEKRGLKMTKVVRTAPDEYTNFVLTDEEILKLARWGALIEDHYTKRNGKWTPMDIEWAKDGTTGELFIVQARPETVHAGRDYSKMREYARKPSGVVLARGASVGNAIASGKARVILHPRHIRDFQKGEVLVTTMTDPDWEPVMKIASAIVTDKGGRTSHAAIVSRELGIPAVVGTENATRKIKTGDPITIDTTGSAGLVLQGKLPFRVIEHDMGEVPKLKTRIMMNVAMPDTAFAYSFLPTEGVGLAREEFIITSAIGIHPLALLNVRALEPKLRVRIEKKMRGWRGPVEFYIDNLAFGIAKIGAAFYPKPVIVRFSDFKTNEYRTLLGGAAYEPREENPMIGWRGASRYYDPKFTKAFALECRAIQKVRRVMGLTNVIPMVPFCRTVEEAKRVVAIMAQNGLDRKKDSSLRIYVMCEIPSNAILADEFLRIFDGMSIGSNDLTQLTLGLDRDAGALSHIANENNPAVRRLIAEVIAACKRKKKYVGICGQGPSDYPDFAAFLLQHGIESISLNPDAVVKTIFALAKK